jgi:hypothetical protein
VEGIAGIRLLTTTVTVFTIFPVLVTIPLKI